MSASFFFYDLETSGLDPRQARIMQFAGQRTDMELKPINEPVNTLIKLTPDVLPDPDAVLVTGITPQATLADGITEAEFLRKFHETVCQPETTFVGFNSVRFDDEFMRFLQYRNFCDAYEWQWCDGCSRWDMLDVVRMTRALRPDGITWPFASDGSPMNRLESLTSVNRLDHDSAHDALSDVRATIAVARLIRNKQPKLFNFLFDMRDKKKVAALVETGQPFIYTSGSYDRAYEKTTVAIRLAPLPNSQGALVYDLRYDPTPLLKLDVKALTKQLAWQPKREDRKPFPVKALRYNRCPAVAPMNVLNTVSQQRLKLDVAAVEMYRRILAESPDLALRCSEAFAARDEKPKQSALIANEQWVDGQLYDGFVDDQDKKMLMHIRKAPPEQLLELTEGLHDERLKILLPLYKARNYPEALTSEERTSWEAFCSHRLLDGGQAGRLAKYFERLRMLDSAIFNDERRYLLQELRLYGESIMPAEL